MTLLPLCGTKTCKKRPPGRRSSLPCRLLPREDAVGEPPSQGWGSGTVILDVPLHNSCSSGFPSVRRLPTAAPMDQVPGGQAQWTGAGSL